MTTKTCEHIQCDLQFEKRGNRKFCDTHAKNRIPALVLTDPIQHIKSNFNKLLTDLSIILIDEEKATIVNQLITALQPHIITSNQDIPVIVDENPTTPVLEEDHQCNPTVTDLLTDCSDTNTDTRTCLLKMATCIADITTEIQNIKTSFQPPRHNNSYRQHHYNNRRYNKHRNNSNFLWRQPHQQRWFGHQSQNWTDPHHRTWTESRQGHHQAPQHYTPQPRWSPEPTTSPPSWNRHHHARFTQDYTPPQPSWTPAPTTNPPSWGDVPPFPYTMDNQSHLNMQI